MAWEGYREIVQADRDQVRKCKALVELSLVRNIKCNRKSLYRYFGDKRKMQENVGLSWKEIGNQVTRGMEKPEVPNQVLPQPSPINAPAALHECRRQRQDWGNEGLPAAGGDLV